MFGVLAVGYEGGKARQPDFPAVGGERGKPSYRKVARCGDSGHQETERRYHCQTHRGFEEVTRSTEKIRARFSGAARDRRTR